MLKTYNTLITIIKINVIYTDKSVRIYIKHQSLIDSHEILPCLSAEQAVSSTLKRLPCNLCTSSI